MVEFYTAFHRVKLLCAFSFVARIAFFVEIFISRLPVGDVDAVTGPDFTVIFIFRFVVKRGVRFEGSFNWVRVEFFEFFFSEKEVEKVSNPPLPLIRDKEGLLFYLG